MHNTPVSSQCIPRRHRRTEPRNSPQNSTPVHRITRQASTTLHSLPAQSTTRTTAHLIARQFHFTTALDNSTRHLGTVHTSARQHSTARRNSSELAVSSILTTQLNTRRHFGTIHPSTTHQSAPLPCNTRASFVLAFQIPREKFVGHVNFIGLQFHHEHQLLVRQLGDEKL